MVIYGTKLERWIHITFLPFYSTLRNKEFGKNSQLVTDVFLAVLSGPKLESALITSEWIHDKRHKKPSFENAHYCRRHDVWRLNSRQVILYCMICAQYYFHFVKGCLCSCNIYETTYVKTPRSFLCILLSSIYSIFSIMQNDVVK